MAFLDDGSIMDHGSIVAQLHVDRPARRGCVEYQSSPNLKQLLHGTSRYISRQIFKKIKKISKVNLVCNRSIGSAGTTPSVSQSFKVDYHAWFLSAW